MNKKQETMSNEIHAHSIASTIGRTALLVAIIGISSIMFLYHLGANTLANWDEAWYADASRYMFHHEHFLTPVWNGQYFFDKPPLQYWVTQAFMSVFGEIPLSYRLPSALACIGLVMLTFVWATKRNGILGGIAASVVLLSFPHFVDRGRSGNFDGMFLFWVTSAVFLFLKKHHAWGGICLGLAWMTKGIFSGFFPIVALIPFALCDIWKYKSMAMFRSVLIFLAAAISIYAPWHILEANRFDDLIEKSYFATFDQGEFGGWNWMSIVWRFDFRYLVFLWTSLRWWFPVLCVAVLWKLNILDKAIRSKAAVETQRLLEKFFPIVMSATIFCALSAAKEKNDWYIMPTYPYIALLVAEFLLWLSRKRKALMAGSIIVFAFINVATHRKQAFPGDRHLPERQVAEYVKSVTSPSDMVVTAEYEFPVLRYYSEREVRTTAPQPDYEGKYWWIWDNIDIATALRHGKNIVTIHRPGTEWSIDVPGYRREEIGELNGRIISRLVPE